MTTRKLVLGITVIAVALACASGCGKKPTQDNQPVLTIFYNAEEQPAEKNSVAQILQAQLRSHGIQASLEPVTNSIFYDRLAKGQFQATLALWYLDYADQEGFLTDFYTKASFRMAKYSSSEFDKSYLAGLYSSTEQEKRKNFQDAASILSHDLPWIPLYSNDEIFFFASGSDGFASNAYQYYDYRHVARANIRAASDIEIQTFDPALAYDLASKHVVCQSYEGLIALDESSNIVPSLATSWSFSNNNKTLTFHLRPDVHFHGPAIFQNESQRKLSASDVKASFERMLKSNSPYSYIFDYVKGVQDFRSSKANDVTGFQVVDPLTFRIEMDRPFPTMLPWLLAPAAYVLPKGLPKNFDFTKSSAGTGPFILKSYDGSLAQFESNPEYWMRDAKRNRLPLAKTLSVRVIKDINAEVTAFRHGELDILNLPVALYTDVFEKDGTVKPEWRDYIHREVKLNNLKFICFNMESRPWGAQQQLRARVAEALDRQAIVRDLFRGKATAETSIIPAAMSFSSSSSTAALK